MVLNLLAFGSFLITPTALASLDTHELLVDKISIRDFRFAHHRSRLVCAGISFSRGPEAKHSFPRLITHIWAREWVAWRHNTFMKFLPRHQKTAENKRRRPGTQKKVEKTEKKLAKAIKLKNFIKSSSFRGDFSPFMGGEQRTNFSSSPKQTHLHFGHNYKFTIERTFFSSSLSQSRTSKSRRRRKKNSTHKKIHYFSISGLRLRLRLHPHTKRSILNVLDASEYIMARREGGEGAVCASIR